MNMERRRWEVELLKWAATALVPLIAVILTVDRRQLNSNVSGYRTPLLAGLSALLLIALTLRLTRLWLDRRDYVMRLRSEVDEKSAQLEEKEALLSEVANNKVAAADLGYKLHTFAAKRLRTEIVESQLRLAKVTIDVVGVANEMVSSDMDEGFFDAFFAHGGTLRVLFIAPKSESVYQRERQEKWPKDHLSVKAKSNMSRLRQYREVTADGKPGSLYVRTYDHAPTVNMVLIDGVWGLVHHYGWSAHGTETPTLEIGARRRTGGTDGLEPAGSGAQVLLDYYAREFEILWSLGDPVTLK